MKQYLLSLLCLVSVVANATFVDLDLTGKNIPLIEATAHFEDWFGVPDKDLVLYFEETDELGYRHQNYQQYSEGVLVENCALFVHSFDGIITAINGDIMPTNLLPATVENVSVMKRTRKIVNDENGQDKGIVIIHIGDNFYKTFKIKVGLEEIYYDVETGREIQRLPLVNFGNVNCTLPTLYSGTKTVPCNYSDGYYHLYDSQRNVYVRYGDMGANFSEPISSYEFKCNGTNWSGHFLTSITITQCRNGWWNSLGDANPDLYVTVENGNGVILYTTDYKSDATYVPLTFNFSIPISIPSGGGGYKIKVWDKDVISDELGTTITLNSNDIGTYTWGSNTSNIEGKLVIQEASPMYDAYWGIVNVHKFYQDIFGINGFDNNGTATRVFLHTPTYGAINKEEGCQTLGFLNYTANYNNAFAFHEEDNPSKAYITFGMGNENGNPQVGYNTICHEFTHLVTAYRPIGDLVYSGEAGAINEGYSDAMAITAEHYLCGSTDWKYDKESVIDATHNCIRDIRHPEYGEPDGQGGWIQKPLSYGDAFWIDPSSSKDKGGVHINNSIFTFWFYLLSEGGSGTNDNGNIYKVEKIGIEKAAKIAWRMHRSYLPAQATFSQARKWAIQSAKDLYSNDKDIEKAVTNAWYAVGVGEAYYEQFELKPGKYAIVAHRDNDTDKNWYYMTATKDGTKDRFVAVNTNETSISNVNLTDLAAEYIWDLEEDGDNWKLKNGSQYITWTSNNTAKLDAQGKTLTFNIAENQVQAHFNDGSAERYLSLNATTGNNYFAFYGNTSQITYLYFLPIEEDTPEPPVTTNEYYIVAKRSTGNYYFFTPNKVSGKDRLIAVNAGTSVRAQIDTINTTDDYVWTLEDSGTGKLLKSHNGTYLTCTEAKSADMASTGIVLNMASNNDGTVTFSYAADATTTHYLSLATAGNDYFVFYGNTNQTTHLLLMPKGTNSPATDLLPLPYEGKDGIGSVKFIKDGRLLIERNGILYNAHGARVK